MKLAFRKARPRDLPDLVRVHTAAYPDDRDAAARRRAFEQTGMGSMSDVHVALLDGAVVAHAFLYRASAFFGGSPVQTGAIASVGVAPEARGRGVATALMAHLHQASAARGDALTMLYAFRGGFYARLGYGPTRPFHRLVFAPAAIPAAWSTPRHYVGKSEPRELRRAYAAVAKARTGWLSRSTRWWTRWAANPRRYVIALGGGRRGAVVGYVSFFLEQQESHAETRLLVDELVAPDDASRRALLGALAGMRDQAREIELETAMGDALSVALTDPDRLRSGTDLVEHAIGDVVAGPLVRLSHVKRALAARGYASDGVLDLVVTEPTGRHECIRMNVSRGTCRSSAGERNEAVALDRATLASVLYGGVLPSEACAVGLARGSARALTRADRILRLPAPVPVDKF